MQLSKDTPAIVTGGASGLGEATARLLAGAGWAEEQVGPRGHLEIQQTMRRGLMIKERGQPEEGPLEAEGQRCPRRSRPGWCPPPRRSAAHGCAGKKNLHIMIGLLI